MRKQITLFWDSEYQTTSILWLLAILGPETEAVECYDGDDGSEDSDGRNESDEENVLLRERGHHDGLSHHQYAWALPDFIAHVAGELS